MKTPKAIRIADDVTSLSPGEIIFINDFSYMFRKDTEEGLEFVRSMGNRLIHMIHLRGFHVQGERVIPYLYSDKIINLDQIQ